MQSAKRRNRRERMMELARAANKIKLKNPSLSVKEAIAEAKKELINKIQQP